MIARSKNTSFRSQVPSGLSEIFNNPGLFMKIIDWQAGINTEYPRNKVNLLAAAYHAPGILRLK